MAERTPHPNALVSAGVAALSHKGRGHNNVDAPPPDFPNRTTFVIAWFCVFARSSAAIDGARGENASKNDDYHIN